MTADPQELADIERRYRTLRTNATTRSWQAHAASRRLAELQWSHALADPGHAAEVSELRRIIRTEKKLGRVLLKAAREWRDAARAAPAGRAYFTVTPGVRVREGMICLRRPPRHPSENA